MEEPSLGGGGVGDRDRKLSVCHLGFHLGMNEGAEGYLTCPWKSSQRKGAVPLGVTNKLRSQAGIHQLHDLGQVR